MGKQSKTIRSSKKESEEPSSRIISSILGPSLRTGSTQVPTDQALCKKEFILLYFGAHWSPLSLKFTDELVKFNKKVSSAVEVVYVSSDQTREEYEQHLSGMPWPAMNAETPEDSKRKDNLVPVFQAFRIPCLIVLHGPTGEFITEHGRKDVVASLDEPDMALKKWREIPRLSIDDGTKLIDHGGGMKSMLSFLYKYPVVASAIIAALVLTPLHQILMKKPLWLVGGGLLLKRWTTPEGDRNIPGRILDESKQD